MAVHINTWYRRNGYIFARVTARSTVQTGPYPVPSNPNDDQNKNDPYRCVLVGILVGLTFLSQFEKKLSIQTNVVVSCDSDSALLVPSSYRYINATAPHFDVARSLIASKLHYAPVQGHADSYKPEHELTRTEILNRTCDTITKAFREKMETSFPVFFPK